MEGARLGAEEEPGATGDSSAVSAGQAQDAGLGPAATVGSVGKLALPLSLVKACGQGLCCPQQSWLSAASEQDKAHCAPTIKASTAISAKARPATVTIDSIVARS